VYFFEKFALKNFSFPSALPSREKLPVFFNLQKVILIRNQEKEQKTKNFPKNKIPS